MDGRKLQYRNNTIEALYINEGSGNTGMLSALSPEPEDRQTIYPTVLTRLKSYENAYPQGAALRMVGKRKQDSLRLKSLAVIVRLVGSKPHTSSLL
jgi:hypothetical protein